MHLYVMVHLGMETISICWDFQISIQIQKLKFQFKCNKFPSVSIGSLQKKYFNFKIYESIIKIKSCMLLTNWNLF